MALARMEVSLQLLFHLLLNLLHLHHLPLPHPLNQPCQHLKPTLSLLAHLPRGLQLPPVDCLPQSLPPKPPVLPSALSKGRHQR